MVGPHGMYEFNQTIDVPEGGVAISLTVPADARLCCRPYLDVWAVTDGKENSPAGMMISVFDASGGAIGGSDQCWCCLEGRENICEIHAYGNLVRQVRNDLVMVLQPRTGPRTVKLSVLAFEPYE